ncbi:MAG: MCP four helix bundle domain-containing protein [Bacteroidales bacterium]
MKLRYKILSGFLLIIVMLLISGSFTIIEFSKISKSATGLMGKHHSSIEASGKMIEALERENTGILLLLQENLDEGAEAIHYGDSLFLASFHIVQNNITEKNEEKYIDSIKDRYERYKQTWEGSIDDLERGAGLNWYDEENHHAFLKVKESVQALMEYNQQSMYEEAGTLKEKAKRAIMPAIIAILLAFIFLFLFNYLLNYYYISPIERLTQELENFPPGKEEIVTKIEARGELRRLKEAIHNMIIKVKRNS